MLYRLLLLASVVFSAQVQAFSIEEIPNHSQDAQVEQPAIAQKPAYLAILIDDMGHSLSSNKAALALPGEVSFAFLPYARHTKAMVDVARQLDRDIILHAPMENVHKIPLGPGGMTSDMSESVFKKVLHQNINAIGHAVGVNNHMGSVLTSLSKQMRWTMEVLNERGLFFIDSITTAKSVAWIQARDAGMAGVKRDVFLDHEINAKAIDRQFNIAIQQAKVNGYAVLIAHPHKLSLGYLKRNLALLKQHDIELVKISRIVQRVKSKELALSLREKL